MFAIKSRAAWGLVAITTLFATGGCLFPGAPTTLTELPAELQIIVDDPSSFTPSPDDPLGDLAAGTAVDDLSHLTGCWGWFEQAGSAREGSAPTAFYEVYQFDADAGTVNRWVFTPSFLLIPPVVAWDQGSFVALDDGRIEIRLDRYTIIDMRTGTGREFTILPDDIAVSERLVTIDGDQLLIADPAYVAGDTSGPIGRIFTRFDCPE